MKRIAAVVISALAIMSLAACGSVGTGGPSKADTQSETKEAPKKAPLDLTGTWVEKDSKSKKMVQEAVIKDGTITVNWKQSDGTTAVYWVGTYAEPTTSDDSYSWTSKADTEKLDSALMASSDKSKKFEYKDGKLTYEVSAMGSTATETLEKN